MHIPRFWVKASADAKGKDDQDLALAVWGWGEDRFEAQREAKSRLERLVERVRKGDPFPGKYAYGNRPLREEILETLPGAEEPRAILSRNRYGATVLNAARLLFLDVDLDENAGGLFSRLFSKVKPEDAALARLRDQLGNAGKGRFRVYRTAAGFRAIAVDREFDPAGKEAQDLMKATGTDPHFIRLCLAQKSFRARLTPKPWRCDLKPPPGEYPREDPEMQRSFGEWLAEYEAVSKRYATCRYLETVGRAAMVDTTSEDLVSLHDRFTRATESLPLA